MSPTTGRESATNPSIRRPLVAANWKMHLVRAEAEAYCRELVAAPAVRGPEVVLFPSFPLLLPVATALAGSGIGLGAQDLHPERAGAFTGDVSAAQIVDVGCGWVLCGHSERRRGHGEDDALVARKVAAALAAGLAPVVCVGETKEERRAGDAFAVLAQQVDGLPLAPEVVLAYEPVWAIGTGETATPGAAADAHAYLRARVARRQGEDFAARLRILYGGSVTPESAAELAAAEEIDGFLVGGASLDPTRFRAIIAPFDAP
jgi:triosephosphate isomerase (TIM)